ncbi:TPA: 2-hydroxyacid dehydrogenase [Serratia marcescens]
MKLAIYSTKQYDRKYLELVNQQFGYELEFFDFLLSKKTAKTAAGCKAVCLFVNDDGSREVLEELAALGVEILALRCAGFNNVDLDAAQELGIKVVRVPAYSPEAVAEHAVGMMMCLNRRIHRAYQRTRDANFSLEGLIGFNMHNRTAGVIGTGKIGVMVINTSRGALIDSTAAIDALKQQKIGALGMDVYENERDLFFEDKSNDVIQDDVFRRLSACHNVLFTGHQAFLTEEALTSISQTTLQNISQLERGEACPNQLNA